MPVHLERAAQELADATANPPYLFELGPDKGRAVLDDLQGGVVRKAAVDISDIVVPTPFGDLAVRIVRPQWGASTLPAVLYLHGAGWVFGNTHTHDRLVRELAVGSHAAVVFPSYELSPEAKYPTALEQCYAATQWLRRHGLRHGLDPERMAVAGDSVGGNLAIALCLLASEREGIPFCYQALFYPVTDAAMELPSYGEFATGYHLRSDAMAWFWEQYTSHDSERDEITASPLRASAERLAVLPPTLVVTAEADILRDEGEAFASKLRAAGVEVAAVRFGGTIHDFVMLNALADTGAARAATSLAVASLRQALGTAL
ncbi:MAG TPA: alpha/beta hydrolase [Acidimicrobiales bacterium]|nr:alpha/beta hydrolase [Acidimicrobiales bacterium]